MVVIVKNELPDKCAFFRLCLANQFRRATFAPDISKCDKQKGISVFKCRDSFFASISFRYLDIFRKQTYNAKVPKGKQESGRRTGSSRFLCKCELFLSAGPSGDPEFYPAGALRKKVAQVSNCCLKACNKCGIINQFTRKISACKGEKTCF